MKKLKVVTSVAPIVGYILANSYGEFYLEQYGYDKDGDYIKLGFYDWDEPSDEMIVFNQPNLASRIKKLHHYFPKAEYISEEVIEHLNFEKEDVKTALDGLVEF